MSRPVHLFVSPHLDDAVFSSPAWLADSRRNGARTVVLTLFTTAGVSADPATVASYELRRAEDQAALAVLDAEPIHAGLVDAPFRSDQYRSFEGLLFGAIDPHDAAPSQVDACIADTVARLKPVSIRTTLAVGGHIDHRITFDAVRRLERRLRTVPVAYAEDRPYCLVDGATALRLASLGCHGALPCPPCDRFVTELLHAPYVLHHLAPACRSRVAACARDLCAASSRTGRSIEAEAVLTPWSLDDADLFLQAMQAYKSQIDAFFGSPDQARLHLRQGAAQARQERAWRMTCPDA
jgi:LmbE family N-acetylglucosaminyl deacetylase